MGAECGSTRRKAAECIMLLCGSISGDYVSMYRKSSCKILYLIVFEINTTKNQSSCLKVSFNGLRNFFIKKFHVVQQSRAVQRVWVLLFGTRGLWVLLGGGNRVF